MSAHLHDLQSRFLHSLFRQSDAIRGHLNDRSQARLGIYQSGYLTRLRENLKAVYPALHAHLGEDFFAALARGYIGRHPSAHFSLYDFGARFADFLIETQNGETGLELPVDIARYERALSEVGRSAAWTTDSLPEASSSGPDLQTPLNPGSLTLNPSCQLLMLSHDVRALVRTLRAGINETDPPTPPLPPAEPEPVSLAVWRVGRVTHAERLEENIAQGLSQLHRRKAGLEDQVPKLDPHWCKHAQLQGLLRHENTNDA